jgi:hypothetical protein
MYARIQELLTAKGAKLRKSKKENNLVNGNPELEAMGT